MGNRNLIVSENIKNDLIIYIWQNSKNGKDFTVKNNKLPPSIFIPKYCYFHSHQLDLLKEHKFTGEEILSYLTRLSDANELPKRLLPKIDKVTNCFKEGININFKNHNQLLKVVIQEAFISLLEQKFENDWYTQELVKLFHAMFSHSVGLTFDEYIHQWAKRITTNYIIK